MRMLLHVCCGPCLSGAFPVLSSEHKDITGFFFNPNIHPEDEFAKRIGAAKQYASTQGVEMVIDIDFDREKFEREVVSKAGHRCENCYRLRIGRTAKFAKEKGFDTISTTLLLSPYQKHEKIREIGEAEAKNHGIIFHYRDLRPYYKASVAASKAMGLYRQKYCGCGESKKS